MSRVRAWLRITARFSAIRKLLVSQNPSGSKTSRRYVLAGGLAAVGTVASPQVSRAQTQTLRFQSAWRPKDILHDFALAYAKSVSDMTGGTIPPPGTISMRMRPPVMSLTLFA